MTFQPHVKIMVGTLLANRLRALMGVGAVALAIASMAISLALGSGAEREMQAIADRVGKNLFMIIAGRVEAPPGRGQGWFTSTRLTLRDVNGLSGQSWGVRKVVPIAERSLSVKLNAKDMVTSIRGITPDFFGARNFQIESGRSLDDVDERGLTRVAVVGPFVASKLNDGRSMVGERIRIGAVTFAVVGQLKAKGVSEDGTNEDDQILVPLTTAMRRLLNVDHLSRVLVQVKDQARMMRVQDQTRELLRENHDLDAGVKDDFEILNLVRSNEIKRINSAMLQGMSQLFAFITLSLGAAGIFAITYLNVRDRTAEIGLRRAIGATRRDIALLFMSEACLLSAVGGLGGLAVGSAAALALEQLTHWQVAIDWRGILFPFSTAALLGLLASAGPAISASRLTPVEALHSA